MQNETVGWVKSIHETRYGELLGLVMVGPHVTDLIEAGVVAIDAEATVETVADGMAAHPTLSEAIKEAGPRRARPRDPHPEPQARAGEGLGRRQHPREVPSPPLGVVVGVRFLPPPGEDGTAEPITRLQRI